jgi:uncharacterized protein (DUF1015 family)
MPIIRPFRGLRYDPSVAGNLSDLVAPPYDIIYDEWRERLYQRNPYNIVRLIKTKDEPGDNDKINKYSKAGDFLQTWVKKDILKTDEKPAIYVMSDTYLVDGTPKTRLGFIALIKIEPFGNGIYAHERTLLAPKVDRMNLIKATRTNISQIFSIYTDPDNYIQPVLETVTKTTPDINFIDEEGITRKMWVVNDIGIISGLCSTMEKRNVFIADGHHRYETSMAYREFMENTRTNMEEPFDYVSMYFSNADDPGMTILPTHRKVGGLQTFDENTFFKNIAQEFDVTFYNNSSCGEIVNRIKEGSEKTNIFGIYTPKGFAIARYRNSSNPKELDVDILHNLIIEKKLGITPDDIAKGRYLHFCKSPEHAYDDVMQEKDQIAFFMNALTSTELSREVLKGRRMPQKSTYFYPKTVSGLVMYRIERESLG